MRSTVTSLLLVFVAACDGDMPDDTVPGSSEGSSGTTGEETGDTPTTDQDDGSTGDADSTSTTTTTDDDVCPVTPTVAQPASVIVVEDISWATGVSGLEGLPAWDGTYQYCAVRPTCDGNTAPVLAAPQLFLNGAYADPGTPIVAGDRVGVVIPFIDADCNLVGGSIETDAVGPEIYSGGSNSIDEMACSSGPGLGFDLGRPDPGVTTFALELTDVCGASVQRDAQIFVGP